MEAPDDARYLGERSVGCDPIHMLRVHDLTLDVIEDLTALLVDAVNAGCTLKAPLLQVDEESMNARRPGASWTTHRVVDSHNLFVCVAPERTFSTALEITASSISRSARKPSNSGRQVRAGTGSPRALAVRASAR